AVPGYPDDRGPTIEQTSNDVFLCPGVDEQYAQPSDSVVRDSRRWCEIEHVRHVHAGWVNKADAALTIVEQELAIECALHSEMARQPARINSAHRRHAVGVQPGAQRPCRSAVSGPIALVMNDQPLHLNRGTFKRPLRDAVIALQGIRQDEKLPAIRRIR